MTRMSALETHFYEVGGPEAWARFLEDLGVEPKPQAVVVRETAPEPKAAPAAPAAPSVPRSKEQYRALTPELAKQLRQQHWLTRNRQEAALRALAESAETPVAKPSRTPSTRDERNRARRKGLLRAALGMTEDEAAKMVADGRVA